MIGESGFDS